MKTIKFCIYQILLLWMLTTIWVACKPKEPPVSQQTLLMYFPWCSNLQAFFRVNISDMQTAIVERGGLNDERVLVYYATHADSAALYEIQYSSKTQRCSMIPIASFTHMDYTSADHITTILKTVQQHAPALNYALIIGSHGLGWIPADDYYTSKSALNVPERHQGKDEIIMRFYGDINNRLLTDITTLAQGMEQAKIHTQYILFDCCNMANIELAYELKDVTDYVIASVSEIWGTGMPYSTIGNALLGQPDYHAICNSYLTYCQSLSYPCGTLSVTSTSQLNELASFTNKIQTKYTWDDTQKSNIQKYDAYTDPIFYDYADYISHWGLDSDEKDELEKLMQQVVPYSSYTPYYFCEKTRRMYPIRTYCGLTTSAPSVNACCVHFTSTSWHIACQNQP